MSLDIFRDHSATQPPYSAQAAALPPRCQDLINQALQIWPDANVKLHYFEKVLQQSNDQASTLTFGLRLFNIILKHQLNNFVVSNINQIQNILQVTSRRRRAMFFFFTTVYYIMNYDQNRFNQLVSDDKIQPQLARASALPARLAGQAGPNTRSSSCC